MITENKSTEYNKAVQQLADCLAAMKLQGISESPETKKESEKIW